MCGAGWPPGNLRRIANPPLEANWRAIFESGHDTASAVLWSFYISVSATVAPAVLPPVLCHVGRNANPDRAHALLWSLYIRERAAI
ncbi:MAG: hypothetical protein ACLQPN_23215 [Bryobacteraceae bacterium]